jgi:hypothetical protein
MKNNVILAVAVVLFSISIANADIKNEYSLPPDLQIVTPGTDVPPSLALFSGAWAGQWRKTPCLYVFEKITNDQAVVVFSEIPGRGGEVKWRRYKNCKIVKLDDGYMIEIRGSLGTVTQFRRTNMPNYIRGIRWGVNYKYDNVPINFQKVE